MLSISFESRMFWTASGLIQFQKNSILEKSQIPILKALRASHKPETCELRAIYSAYAILDLLRKGLNCVKGNVLKNMWEEAALINQPHVYYRYYMLFHGFCSPKLFKYSNGISINIQYWLCYVSHHLRGVSLV